MSLNFQELREVEDLHRQSEDAEVKSRLEEDPNYQAWCAAKRIVWMILLAGSFLFFYLIMKMHEALSLI